MCSHLQCMQLHEYIANNSLGIPAAEPLVAGDTVIPYYFQGDDDFVLKTWLMKLYTET